MSSLTQSNTQVTRYRVTLDFTVNDSNCTSPSDWNWRELLELDDNVNERIKEVYVENLGQIATKKVTTKRGNRHG
tara:strand:- start:313 stop:537 length:225 start_codon:yes stop_codon:yes gene_type:complete